jgi:hypothetical protein
MGELAALAICRRLGAHKDDGRSKHVPAKLGYAKQHSSFPIVMLSTCASSARAARATIASSSIRELSAGGKWRHTGTGTICAAAQPVGTLPTACMDIQRMLTKLTV